MEVADFHPAVQIIDGDILVGISGQKKKEIKFSQVIFVDSKIAD